MSQDLFIHKGLTDDLAWFVTKEGDVMKEKREYLAERVGRLDSYDVLGRYNKALHDLQVSIDAIEYVMAVPVEDVSNFTESVTLSKVRDALYQKYAILKELKEAYHE